MPEDTNYPFIVRLEADVNSIKNAQRTCQTHYDEAIKRVEKDLDYTHNRMDSIDGDLDELKTALSNTESGVRVMRYVGGLALLGILVFNTMQLHKIADSMETWLARVSIIETRQQAAIADDERQHKTFQDRLQVIESMRYGK